MKLIQQRGINYTEAMAREQAALQVKPVEEALFVWELQPVYVTGQGDTEARHTRINNTSNLDAPLVQSNREGGDMWQGPGQLRSTIVMDLMTRDIPVLEFRSKVESVLNDTFAEYGITFEYGELPCILYTGGKRIGIHTTVIQREKVSWTGVSINVNPNLAGGIARLVDQKTTARTFTSMAAETRGRPTDTGEVMQVYVNAFERHFNLTLERSA